MRAVVGLLVALGVLLSPLAADAIRADRVIQ